MPAPVSGPRAPALSRLAAISPLMFAAVAVLGVLLMAGSAPLAIPLQPVPITLQSYVLFTLAALMGARLSAVSIGLYVALGLAGLPIFSGGRSGLSVLTAASGGYVVGFFVCAVLVGALVERTSPARARTLVGIIALGHALLLVLGVGWLATKIGVAPAIQGGLVPFLPGAIIKTLVAALTVMGVERLLAREAAR